MSLRVDHSLPVTQYWTDYQRKYPIHYAIKQGDITTLKQLLSNPDLDINGYDVNGDTPLILAIGTGDEKIVEVCLENPRTDVNKLSKNEEAAPLLCAAGGGHEKIVLALLKTGKISANLSNSVGTALYHAVFRGHPHVVKILLNYPETDPNTFTHETPLHLTAKFQITAKDIHSARLLLAHPKTQHNVKDEHNQTPLDRAKNVLYHQKTEESTALCRLFKDIIVITIFWNCLFIK